MVAMTEYSDGDVDLIDAEFERLGRLAGAELRQPPPADGAGTVVRSAHRRRATVTAVAAGTTLAMVLTGLFVAASRIQDEPAPISTVPPVVPTTAPSELVDVAPPDAERTTTPGTWRAVEDPTSLAPDFPAAAVWTGTDVIVIGSNATDTSQLSPSSAAAYDVGRDRWRELADPPPALSRDSLEAPPFTMQWTGSEVVAASNQGEVYVYDPVQDLWESRARPDESTSLPSPDALVAVSARGVLARSSMGWWWYEHTTDRWESVPAPPDGDGRSILAALDQDRIVAASIDDATITSAVFDIASRTWRSGPPVENAPVVNRNHPTTCDANDGLLVCWADGFGELDGIVIDPLVGRLARFALGNHSNTLTTKGLPWMTHAWKLLSPRSATWEDLPPDPDADVDSFSAAVWTGSEIVFLGGSHSATGEPLGAAAAYTPMQLPGR
jgi:hypothetical protein